MPSYLLDQEASEKTLSLIARESVMFTERELGTSLGMEYRDIVRCVEDERIVRERKFKVLYQWKRQNGRDASNRALIRGLARCGTDRVLLESVVHDILIDEGLNDVSHDGPTTTTDLPVTSQPNQRFMIPMSFFVFVLTVVKAGFPWAWLQQMLVEYERKKAENVSLSKERNEMREAYAQLRTQCTQAENERDDEREKSRRLSVELEKLRHSEKFGSVCSNSIFKEEPPGDRKIAENTTSFSSLGSTSQLDICTTQFGNFPLLLQPLDMPPSQRNPLMLCQSLDVSIGQHDDSSTLHRLKIVANVEFNVSSASSPTKEAIYPDDNHSSSECQAVPLQVNISSELEVLTPDVDEDCNSDSSLNDDSETSECAPSSTAVSQIIKHVIHVGTKRDYSLLHNKDAQTEWANSPGPKRQKI